MTTNKAADKAQKEGVWEPQEQPASAHGHLVAGTGG